jgi:orotate phosphoribosyltransferase/AMMECR1 domain-containing protein
MPGRSVSSVPEAPEASLSPPDRNELRALLRSDGMVWATHDQPVVHRDGQPAPWAFYSWGVTLTGRGMVLAARAILERLATFRSTQLASYGYTGMPLLSACVLLGQGRYTGLCIRDRRKAYLTRRRIDGPADPGRPVVVVDDSISSGTSLHAAIEALEADGFDVEGAVALVTFPHRGGAEWAYGHGYRVETVFDVWRDLDMADAARRLAPRVRPSPITVGAIESGLHPAIAARRIAESYLATGLPPKPPAALDSDYDSRGGVFVSFRQRVSEQRVAREGLWHFDSNLADPCADLVAATLRTVDASVGAITKATLPSLKVSVTFCKALERIAPAGLDFGRYAIVVRDSTFRTKLGGALPNTQVFVSEIEQYTHARERNARITATEPHDLYRHEVTKHVEPGESWLPYGIPDGLEMAWSLDARVGQLLTARARSVAIADGTGVEPLDDTVVPYPTHGIAVALYRHGLVSSGLARGTGPLDELVETAARRAVEAVKPVDLAHLHEPDLAVAVCVLHDREQLTSSGLTAVKLRRGLDAVSVRHGERQATMLPGALPYNNWTPQELVTQVAAAAGSRQQSGTWSTYRTTTWLSDQHGLKRLLFGFPERPTGDLGPDPLEAMVELLAAYIVRNLGPDGLPVYYLEAVSGRRSSQGTSPRIVHGLLALEKAGRLLRRPRWRDPALEGLLRCLNHVRNGSLDLPGQANAAIGDCALLAGVLDAGEPLSGHRAVPELGERVAALFHPDGRICELPVRLNSRRDHDFLPGAAMVAFFREVRAGQRVVAPGFIDPQLRWHRDRFRLLRSWGMAGWQPQGWAEAWLVTSDAKHAEYVSEIADWVLDRQLEKNGAFLEDLSPTEPSFNTGFIAEGLAAAWKLALLRGEADRADRYGSAWRRAMAFLQTLVIHPEDTFCCADPERAVGGVRISLTRSDVRIDAVSHTLHALLNGLENLGAFASGNKGTKPLDATPQ